MTLADRIILALASLFIFWLYFHYWTSEAQSANYAIVLVPNQPPLRIILSSPQQLPIPGRIGNSVIEVEPGRIRFIASPCRGKQCIHAGWLSHGGDFAACLPNQVSIEVYSTKDTKFDGISY